jgi:hypothetical protein
MSHIRRLPQVGGQLFNYITKAHLHYGFPEVLAGLVVVVTNKAI